MRVLIVIVIPVGVVIIFGSRDSQNILVGIWGSITPVLPPFAPAPSHINSPFSDSIGGKGGGGVRKRKEKKENYLVNLWELWAFVFWWSVVLGLSHPYGKTSSIVLICISFHSCCFIYIHHYFDLCFNSFPTDIDMYHCSDLFYSISSDWYLYIHVILESIH